MRTFTRLVITLASVLLLLSAVTPVWADIPGVPLPFPGGCGALGAAGVSFLLAATGCWLVRSHWRSGK